jgi:hypothetical protein
MKISLSLLLFFLLTIACKRDKNLELEVLKEATIYLDNNNLKLFKRMEKEVADNGSRQKEVTFLNFLKALLSKRINAKFSSENLKNYKTSIYTFVNDTLKASPKIEFKLNDVQVQNDSSSFNIYYQDILLFEKNMLELALTEVSGSDANNYFSIVYKTNDTISVNEEYSIAVMPDVYLPRRVDLKPYSVDIYRNGEKMTIPFKSEVVGGILLLRISPNVAGNYKLNGTVKIKSLYNEFYMLRNFKDFVIVK